MKKIKNDYIPLYDISISDLSKQEVNSVLNSGWLSAGKKKLKFEKMLCRLWDSKYAVAVNSASEGLILALKANGFLEGDRVITSPYTFVSTIEAIIAVGAVPVFVDILPDNFNLNPDLILKKINSKTKAVIPTDIAGHPADYSKLKNMCKNHGLRLISDSAHAIASEYKDKTIVHWCDTSVVSLHATKNLFSGEGGVVFTLKKKIYDEIRLLSNHGIVRNTDKNKWEYDIIERGKKSNISEINAAIGIGQLSQFKSDQKKRIRIVNRYIRNLSKYKDFLIRPSVSKNAGHGWHLFIIKLKLENLNINRDKFIKIMGKSKIECGVHYKPIFEFSYYKKLLNLSEKSFPVTSKIWKQVVTLPLYPSLKLESVDRICHVIGQVLTKYGKL